MKKICPSSNNSRENTHPQLDLFPEQDSKPTARTRTSASYSKADRPQVIYSEDQPSDGTRSSARYTKLRSTSKPKDATWD